MTLKKGASLPQDSAGFVLALAVFGVLAWAVTTSSVANATVLPAAPQAGMREIGTALMQQYVLPLEVIALMLTAAMIGAVILALRERKHFGDPRMNPLAGCLLVSALLFAVGLAGALTRRSAILVLAGIELMLNAANLNFIAFWRFGTHPAALTGLMFVIFSIAVAAGEAAVGLALILAIYRHTRTSDVSEITEMKG